LELASARARGRNGGRPFKMTAAKLRLAQAAMGKPGTKVGDLCAELAITRQMPYRHIDPNGLPAGWRKTTRPSANMIGHRSCSLKSSLIIC
jgi:hypothetical protein